MVCIPEKASSEIPNDFDLSAEYKAGYSDWASWKVTITGDGRAFQEIHDFRKPVPIQKSFSLSQDDLQELLRRIKESDIFTILESDVTCDDFRTCGDFLIITLTMNAKSHRVQVYDPAHVKDKEGVQRFLKVWSEVLRKVPSPNAEQTADLYGL